MRRASAGVLSAGLLSVGLVAAASPAGARACGIALDSAITEQSALVIERPGHERIILGLDLATDAPGSRAAVVMPVPGRPTVAAIERGDPLAYLERATAPPPEPVGSGGGDDAAAAPVDVIGREEVGGYDVARLRAGDAGALDAWLDANGYTVPDGAQPIVADYIREGWSFVAIQLARGTDGRLKPLDVSFETDRTVYPMRLERLASVPITLTIYTLANGARRADGLEPVWDGRVAELDPPPPAGLAELFEAGDYLTRLEVESAQPSTFRADLEIEPVAAGGIDEPASEAVSRVTEDDNDVSVIAIAAVAILGVALGGLLLRTIGASGPD